MKNWRPEGMKKNPHELTTEDRCMHIFEMHYAFEAGADAMWEALMKHRVKMPPDFTPILIVIPSEAEE